jgi:hypothetical protein
MTRMMKARGVVDPSSVPSAWLKSPTHTLHAKLHVDDEDRVGGLVGEHGGPTIHEDESFNLLIFF